MPDPTPTPRQFKVGDVQQWYDKAMVGEYPNPYHFEGLGNDRDEKAEFIKSKLLPLFINDVYERVALGDKWDAERAATPTPSPTPAELVHPVVKMGVEDELIQEAIGLAGKYKGVKQ